MTLVELVEVDPTQAMGRRVPEWPDHPVNVKYGVEGATFVGHNTTDEDGFGVAFWRSKVEWGSTLTVIAEDEENG